MTSLAHGAPWWRRSLASERPSPRPAPQPRPAPRPRSGPARPPPSQPYDAAPWTPRPSRACSRGRAAASAGRARRHHRRRAPIRHLPSRSWNVPPRPWVPSARRPPSCGSETDRRGPSGHGLARATPAPRWSASPSRSSKAASHPGGAVRPRPSAGQALPLSATAAGCISRASSHIWPSGPARFSVARSTVRVEVVAARVARWDGSTLEDALAEADACGVMARSVEEWAALPQGAAIAPLGRVCDREDRRQCSGSSATSTAASGPAPRASPADVPRRPLEGLRVLDLSRLSGRTRPTAEPWPSTAPRCCWSTRPGWRTSRPSSWTPSHGKRSCCLELEEPAGLAALRALVGGGRRLHPGLPGRLARTTGLGAEALAELRPGIVVVTMNCYGDRGALAEPSRLGADGPDRLGYGGRPRRAPITPVLVPAAACDYTTGYLAALGTLAALAAGPPRAAATTCASPCVRPPAWFTPHVQIVHPDRRPFAATATVAGFGDVDAYLTTSATPYGRLRHLAPVVQMSETPAHWEIPTSPIGTHAPAWQWAAPHI